jgi:hypothetical protein
VWYFGLALQHGKFAGIAIGSTIALNVMMAK